MHKLVLLRHGEIARGHPLGDERRVGGFAPHLLLDRPGHQDAQAHGQ